MISMITVSEAARLLNTSDAFVEELIERGELPAQYGEAVYGNAHTRIKVPFVSQDRVLIYKSRSDEACRVAADELTSLPQEDAS
jgi:excisionase family DNA binding protein